MSGTQKIHNLFFDGASLFLDSMVFIYALEKNPTYLELSRHIIKEIENGIYKGTTSIISTLEAMSPRSLREDLTKVNQIASFFINATTLNIVNIDHRVAYKAAELRRDYKISLPDATQMAVALLEKCDVFITNDDIFRKIKPMETLLLDDIL